MSWAISCSGISSLFSTNSLACSIIASTWLGIGTEGFVFGLVTAVFDLVDDEFSSI